jgi:hypothetical protein
MVTHKQIENILCATIVKASESSGVSCKETMLIITTENNETAHPVYIVQNSQTRKKLLFNDIYSGMFAGVVESKARELLSKSVIRFSKEKEVLPTQVRIMVITNDDHCDKMFYYLDIKHEDGHKDQTQMELNKILSI